MATLNFLELKDELIKIVSKVIEKNTELESEDRSIIEHGIGMFTSILLFSRECRENFISKKEASCEFVLRGLFSESNENTRKIVARSFYILGRVAKKYPEDSIYAKYIDSENIFGAWLL